MKRLMAIAVVACLVGCGDIKIQRPPAGRQFKLQGADGSISDVTLPDDPTLPVMVVPSPQQLPKGILLPVQRQETIIDADGNARTVTIPPTLPPTVVPPPATKQPVYP